MLRARALLALAHAVALTALLLLARPAGAAWTFEGFLGDSFSADSPLTIRQEGKPDIHFTAHWETRPVSNAPYYALRAVTWTGDRGWYADLLHHKTYLLNTTDEVRKFEVTFGYNLLSAGMIRRSGDWAFLGGLGPVVTNPSSVVRGLKHSHGSRFLGTGYGLDGVQGQLGVNRRLALTDHLFLTTDLRLSAAWARVPVVHGDADVPNYALHLLIGLGWKAGNK